MKLLLLFCLVALSAAKTRWHDLEKGYSFEQYVKEFSKTYADSKEIAFRKSLFEENLVKIKAHNAAGRSLYKQGVNRFTDMTIAERKQFLGLNRGMLYNEKRTVHRPAAASAPLPIHKDWRDEGIISTVKDQGQCGSCWTFGSSETVESYWALATGDLPVLSQQFLVDCAPNPQDCGGTGGCQGSTATLALDTIIRSGGIPQEWTYPYESYFGVSNFTCKNDTEMFTPFAKISGQAHLPTNEQEPVLQTLASTGPLIVNVDASQWFAYEAGVYDGCSANATIDHVVQAVGYGHDATLKEDYFLIRNSWNPSWGEEGFIRLHRPATPVCGYDNNPSVGNGCNGGPDRVQVCGQCGVLFATSYPVIAAQ